MQGASCFADRRRRFYRGLVNAIAVVYTERCWQPCACGRSVQGAHFRPPAVVLMPRCEVLRSQLTAGLPSCLAGLEYHRLAWRLVMDPYPGKRYCTAMAIVQRPSGKPSAGARLARRDDSERSPRRFSLARPFPAWRIAPPVARSQRDVDSPRGRRKHFPEPVSSSGL